LGGFVGSGQSAIMSESKKVSPSRIGEENKLLLKKEWEKKYWERKVAAEDLGIRSGKTSQRQP